MTARRPTLLGMLILTVASVPSPIRAAPPAATLPAGADPSRYFAIEVVDEQTGRGVPLIELKTVSGVRYVTDSAGVVAFDDPAMFGQTTFFFVAGHGYEHAKDGFGFPGVRLDVKPGGSARVKVKRLNVAERLYRITGEGVYRDSVLLGRPVPVKQPLLNGQVAGQDSAQQAVYRGKVYWFFGDTMRPGYPLGHFWMSGATSELSANGGLDPSKGLDLTYFVDDTGFSRGTYPRVDNHPAWLDGYTVLPDESGRERLLARVQIMQSLEKCVARKLAVWNDERAMFEDVRQIPMDAPLFPVGHPVRAKDADGVDRLYFGECLPHVRCRADWKGIQDLSSYEAFTPLAPGARWAGVDTKLDRDADGKLRWAWKRDTAPIDVKQINELVERGRMKAGEAWFVPTDVETRKPVALGMGSVRFNPFRKRWTMIAGQLNGSSSFLGEIYYAEADKPEGPWPWARKIVTHDKYSFYNPVQHPFFEQEGGRVVYFQGTYTGTFSRESDFTPRYEYNQIMYRLDLSDPRLALPSEAPAKVTTLPKVW